MKQARFSLFVSVLVMSLALAVAGCGSVPPGEDTSAAQAPTEVQGARDAAVTFVREHFEEAPAESLSWVEEKLTPEGLVGGEEWQYTAGGWVVKVSYGVVAPEWMVYHVAVSNESTGFEWEGRVDGSGRAPEAPENALLARDQALLYVSEQHGQSGLGAGLAWQEERLTPENIVGGETYQYTAGDWVVTVAYPVVLPENTIYTISVANESSGFQWEGEVDAQGTLTELSAPTSEELFGRVAARYVAANYACATYNRPPLGQAVVRYEETLAPVGANVVDSFDGTADGSELGVAYLATEGGLEAEEAVAQPGENGAAPVFLEQSLPAFAESDAEVQEAADEAGGEAMAAALELSEAEIDLWVEWEEYVPEMAEVESSEDGYAVEVEDEDLPIGSDPDESVPPDPGTEPWVEEDVVVEPEERPEVTTEGEGEVEVWEEPDAEVVDGLGDVGISLEEWEKLVAGDEAVGPVVDAEGLGFDAPGQEAVSDPGQEELPVELVSDEAAVEGTEAWVEEVCIC